jgi:hypothetical protein
VTERLTAAKTATLYMGMQALGKNSNGGNRGNHRGNTNLTRSKKDMRASPRAVG